MAKLRQDAESGKPSITHVAVIHHETTAGVLNPLERLTKELKSAFPPSA
jgi:aspartate aminotransferase-like enzyme